MQNTELTEAAQNHTNFMEKLEAFMEENKPKTASILLTVLSRDPGNEEDHYFGAALDTKKKDFQQMVLNLMRAKPQCARYIKDAALVYEATEDPESKGMDAMAELLKKLSEIKHGKK